MNLELKVSERMSLDRENETIRMSPLQMRKFNVAAGRNLSLTTYSGTKLSLKVQPTRTEDTNTADESSYVSQYVLDTVTGDVSRPFCVTLGCDPEFVFLDANKNILPASCWLPTWGPIGSDGPLAELRPMPATHEDGVVENLRKLIKALPLLVDARFGSPGMVLPQGHSCWQNQAIGFHIHLGAPKELLTYAAPNTKEFLDSFISAMDYFVGIPAMLLEDSNIRRLGDGVYGRPGDYRISSKTIEYRTPGGFHLRHPEYAAGIMGLALCLGEQLLNEYRQLSNNWRNLGKYSNFEHIRGRFNLPQKREIRWALLEPTKCEAVKHLPNMIKQLQSLESFPAHREAICKYFQLIMNNTQYSPNILENW